jgi:hypothetical protein
MGDSLAVMLPGPHLYSEDVGRSQAAPGQLGDRSTRFGGYWRWCRDRPSGGCSARNEIFQVLDSLDGIDGHLAESRWERMYLDASKGKLRFGPKLDVGLIPRVPELLEMRLQVAPRHRDPRKRVVLRLYFAEPQEHPRLLLALKFGKKPGGEDTGGTQDRHINDAYFRLREGRRNGRAWAIAPEGPSEILSRDDC